MKNEFPYCNPRTVFQAKCMLINCLTFKYKIPVFSRSGIVCKLTAVTAMLTIMAKLSTI